MSLGKNMSFCHSCGTKSDHHPIDRTPVIRIAPALSDLKISMCSNCLLIQTCDYPTDPNELDKVNTSLGITFNTGLDRATQKFKSLQHLINLDQQSAVVDIGGGAGIFTELLRSHGIQSLNYEPFASVKISDLDLNNFLKEFKGNSVILTFFHVIEHVPNVVFWLKNLLDIFQKINNRVTYTVVIECPVLELETPFSQDPTPYWAAFHVSHFTIGTLERTCERAGLRLINDFCFDDYNGYLGVFEIVRDTKNQPQSKSLELDYEMPLVNSYIFHRNQSLKRYKSRLLQKLQFFDSVCFWGAGIGLDYFKVNLGTIFQNLNVQVVDSSEERVSTGENIMNPHEFFKTTAHTLNNCLIIPTSYAKSREIVQQASELIAASQITSLFEIFPYPHVRAY
jgi:hypothetical protein